MSSLESKGWKLEIVWTPGHSEVQGNDVADRLAKEAAMEAKELGEETSVVTVQDIKRHARVSTRYKWQQRWDIGESGRDFFLCKPFLKSRVSAGLKFTLDNLSKQPQYCSDIWKCFRTFFNTHFYT